MSLSQQAQDSTVNFCRLSAMPQQIIVSGWSWLIWAIAKFGASWKSTGSFLKKVRESGKDLIWEILANKSSEELDF